MERLTEFYGSLGFGCNSKYEKYDDPGLLNKIYDKLGTIEEIEEYLGIELSILFTAIKEGIFILDAKYNIIRDCTDIYLPIDWDNKGFYIECTGDCININQFYYFQDFGKTWALNREKLLSE